MFSCEDCEISTNAFPYRTPPVAASITENILLDISKKEECIDNQMGKVFKNGPSKICRRQPLKIWSDKVCLSKFFKGCLPQILLSLFLNTLPQIILQSYWSRTAIIESHVTRLTTSWTSFSFMPCQEFEKVEWINVSLMKLDQTVNFAYVQVLQKSDSVVSTVSKKITKKMKICENTLSCSARENWGNREFSGLYFPVFGLNAGHNGVNLCIQSKYRKIQTRKNSVYEHFSLSAVLEIKVFVQIKEGVNSAALNLFKLNSTDRHYPYSTYAKFFEKQFTCTCAYQGVRNVSFSENFAYILNVWSYTRTMSVDSSNLAQYTPY